MDRGRGWPASRPDRGGTAPGLTRSFSDRSIPARTRPGRMTATVSDRSEDGRRGESVRQRHASAFNLATAAASVQLAREQARPRDPAC